MIFETFADEPLGYWKKGKWIKGSPKSNILYQLFSIFLPTGFPQSVKPDYLTYQIYDSFQAIFSTLVGILATKELLKGLGVGDQDASASQATLVRLLQDGFSMITRIWFAYRFAPKFVNNVKSWRFMADILNDLGYLLEFTAVSVPKKYFVLVAAVAGMLKSWVGVCGGASRMSLTMHFAKMHNESDLSAKDGSQETLVNLCGMVLGWFMMKELENIADPHVVWTLFLVFTFFHLLCNYLAVCAVELDCLNEERCRIILQEYLRSSKILSPGQVAKRESILTPIFRKKLIQLGNPLTADIIQDSLLQENDAVIRVGDQDAYLKIYLNENIDSEAILMAYLASMLHLVSGKKKSIQDSTLLIVDTDLVSKLETAGWQLHTDALGMNPYRYSVKL